MTQTSASENIHGILVQDPEGTLFTVKELTRKCENFELDYSSGAISGFIDRALKKGVITVFGENTNGKRGRVYKLETREPWDFKPAGVGSYPGREIHVPERKATSEQPVFPYMEMVEQKAVEAEPPLTLVINDTYVGPTPRSWTEVSKLAKSSLTDQLLIITQKVASLENKPTKTLNEYSTDELIEELKRRVK